jgi:hypothetical protein
MDPDPAPQTTVLQGLGLFKIWTTLIITPLVAILIIIGMVAISKNQQNWTRSTATASSPVANCPMDLSNQSKGWICQVPVTVDALPQQTFTLTVDGPQSAAQGQTWPVAFDPAKPKETLTTYVMTPGMRIGIEVGLGIALGLCVLFFFLNLSLRKNKTWQNVSGVM